MENSKYLVLGSEKPIGGAFGVINTKPELLEIINLGINSFSKKELNQIRKLESYKIQHNYR